MKKTTLVSGLSGLLLLACTFSTQAQQGISAQVWKQLAKGASQNAKLKNIKSYRLLKLNTQALSESLKQVPMENTGMAKAQPFTIDLPMPDGSFRSFRMVESPIMEESLALKYPEIKTYSAQGIDDGTMWAKLDYTPLGFHGMIYSTEGIVYIDPVDAANLDQYVVYNKADIISLPKMECTFEHELSPEQQQELNKLENQQVTMKNSGALVELQTYRLALSATGEYTKTKGGTVAGALAGQVVSMNRVNGVYETELAIRMVVIANNDLLISVDGPTDNFDNNNGGTLLGQNQLFVDRLIGKANYDMGHIFSTGGGGIASFQSVCGNNKAQGVTGSPSPVGDAYDIDYVAHEMGHQFGGSHTFNSQAGSCGGGNREAGAAYEPGSGVTIMGYAGICTTDDIAQHSIPYFHTKSLMQIDAFARIGNGSKCPVKTATGNHAPDVDAGPVRYIPRSTPFTLTGSGSDVDGDALTYSWEQFDLGPAGVPNSPSGNAPIFRPFAPTKSPSRTFPQMADVVANKQTKGEIMASYARKMFFHLTARDNRIGGGATAFDTVTVFVVDSVGAFKVTSQPTTESWKGLELREIKWDVSKTTKFPVNCQKVNIHLSVDGGYTFPILLKKDVPNDGTDTIVVPDINTTTARIRVEAADNVFFDLNDADLKIMTPGYKLSTRTAVKSVCAPTTVSFTIKGDTTGGYNEKVHFSASGNAGIATYSFTKDSISAPDSTVLQIGNLATLGDGTYDIKVKTVSNGKPDSILCKLIVFRGAPGQPVLTAPSNNGTFQLFKPYFTWSALASVQKYSIEISRDPGFATPDIVDTALVNNDYVPTQNLNPSTRYYWRTRAKNTCGYGPYSPVSSFETRMASPKSPNQLSGTPISTTQIDLKWTDNSTDEDGFIIFRSDKNSTNYKAIDSVAPNTTTYQDMNLTANTLYYYVVYAYNAGGRSASNNINLRTMASGNASIVTINGIKGFVNVYPNPSKGLLNVALEATPQGQYTIRVLDLSGRLVTEKRLNKALDKHREGLNLSTLERGMYLLSIEFPEGQRHTERISIQ